MRIIIALLIAFLLDIPANAGGFNDFRYRTGWAYDFSHTTRITQPKQLPKVTKAPVKSGYLPGVRCCMQAPKGPVNRP